MNINRTYQLPENQYIREKTPKNQIVLHHTASGRGVDGDFRHWLNTPERIATSYIIAHDGTIYELFSPDFWGYHLGIKMDVFVRHKIKPKYLTDAKGNSYFANNILLEKGSIGIELDSWGPLERVNGRYYSYTGKLVPEEQVQVYGEIYFRRKKYYEKYTPEQIHSLSFLLKVLSEQYNIPLTYRSHMWEVSQEALMGVPGVWTHVSYREDKTDCHPQPELIKMLQELQQ